MTIMAVETAIEHFFLKKNPFITPVFYLKMGVICVVTKERSYVSWKITCVILDGLSHVHVHE